MPLGNDPNNPHNNLSGSEEDESIGTQSSSSSSSSLPSILLSLYHKMRPGSYLLNCTTITASTLLQIGDNDIDDNDDSDDDDDNDDYDIDDESDVVDKTDDNDAIWFWLSYL